MKVAGRSLIFIFLLVFAIHEVSGSNFWSDSGFNKHLNRNTNHQGNAYRGYQSNNVLEALLNAPVEEDCNPADETLSATGYAPLTKHLSYLFEGLVGSDSLLPVPDLNSESIVTSIVIVPRYILYHNLRIPVA